MGPKQLVTLFATDTDYLCINRIRLSPMLYETLFYRSAAGWSWRISIGAQDYPPTCPANKGNFYAYVFVPNSFSMPASVSFPRNICLGIHSFLLKSPHSLYSCHFS